jgi:hypothetical protein
MALAAGTRLGPYEILALSGTGEMGEVYRARDPRPGRDAALKIPPAAYAGMPTGSADSSTQSAQQRRSIIPTSEAAMSEAAISGFLY